MRRRSVLAACVAGLAPFAGCSGDANTEDDSTTPTETPEPGGTPTPSEPLSTETPTATGTATPTTSPTASKTEREFATAVGELTEGVSSFSGNGDTWTLQYRASVVSGDPFERQQAEVAKRFASTRTDGVGLVATVTHECTTLHWKVPAALARKYDGGRLDADEFAARVRNTTTRENNC